MRTKTHRVLLRKSATLNEPLAHESPYCGLSLANSRESAMWNVVKLFLAALVIYMGVSISMNIGDAVMKASAYATATRK